MKFFSYLVIGFLILSGCKNPQPDPYAKPDWITNPSKNGKYIAGVGSARSHIDGRPAQIKIATARALDMIANQMGVEVKTKMLTKKSVRGEEVDSSMDKLSFHTVSGVKVDAILKATWRDVYSDTLYVWMVKK